jgi:hypothetical protein
LQRVTLDSQAHRLRRSGRRRFRCPAPSRHHRSLQKRRLASAGFRKGRLPGQSAGPRLSDPRHAEVRRRLAPIFMPPALPVPEASGRAGTVTAKGVEEPSRPFKRRCCCGLYAGTRQLQQSTIPRARISVCPAQPSLAPRGQFTVERRGLIIRPLRSVRRLVARGDLEAGDVVLGNRVGAIRVLR